MAQIKTRRKMGFILITFHWCMLICTVGLWTPVYLSARRRRVSVTTVPDGYAGPVPGQQAYVQPQQPRQ